MGRLRVVFVDGDLAVLNGLRDCLRRDRDTWDMEFVASAEAALATMNHTPFDVVVTELRLPGMDGAELLSLVAQRHPATMRVVLSSEIGRAAAMRAASVAQQLLAKPCGPDQLRSTLTRLRALHLHLEAPALRELVGRLGELPSVPHTYVALTRAAANPAVSLEELTEIVAEDIALSAKVLQIVNSPFFGFSEPVRSLQRAVSCVGLEILKGLVLSARLLSAADRVPLEGFAVGRFQDRSLLLARVARRFLRASRLAEEAYTAALVQDLGTLILATTAPREFQEVLSEAKRTDRPTHEIEDERLGANHARIGAYLLGSWGVPLTVVESVAWHHEPERVGDGPCPTLAAVHAAGAMMESVAGPKARVGGPHGHLDERFLARSGADCELTRWRAIVDEELLRTPV